MNNEYTHILKPENFEALCGKGFYAQGFAKTSPAPTCWGCRKAAVEMNMPRVKDRKTGKIFFFRWLQEAVSYSVNTNSELMNRFNSI